MLGTVRAPPGTAPGLGGNRGLSPFAPQANLAALVWIVTGEQFGCRNAQRCVGKWAVQMHWLGNPVEDGAGRKQEARSAPGFGLAGMEKEWSLKTACFRVMAGFGRPPGVRTGAGGGSPRGARCGTGGGGGRRALCLPPCAGGRGGSRRVGPERAARASSPGGAGAAEAPGRCRRRADADRPRGRPGDGAPHLRPQRGHAAQVGPPAGGASATACLPLPPNLQTPGFGSEVGKSGLGTCRDCRCLTPSLG